MKKLIIKECNNLAFSVSLDEERIDNHARTYMNYSQDLDDIRDMCKSYSTDFEIDRYIIDHWDEFVEKYNNFLVKRML